NGYGSALGFSGYLGGTSFDAGNAIANDAAGNSYAAGSTFSTDFPHSGSAYQPKLGGGSGFVNSFVTDVNLDDLVPSTGALIFSALIGGSSNKTLTLTNATSGP